MGHHSNEVHRLHALRNGNKMETKFSRFKRILLFLIGPCVSTTRCDDRSTPSREVSVSLGPLSRNPCVAWNTCLDEIKQVRDLGSRTEIIPSHVSLAFLSRPVPGFSFVSRLSKVSSPVLRLRDSSADSFACHLSGTVGQFLSYL